MTITEIAGFAGAGLAGAAYVPQIHHLVKAHCSAGISTPAFEAWLLAALLTTAHAIAIHAGVFIVLGGIQIVATALIMFYAAQYKGTACLSHLSGRPAARAATGTRTREASLVRSVRPAVQLLNQLPLPSTVEHSPCSQPGPRMPMPPPKSK